MGKPGKNKNGEVRLTMQLTTLVVTHSGLNDAQIAEILQPEQAEAYRRNFQRWRVGSRAMSIDSLALFVKQARFAGLLPPANGLSQAFELALFLKSDKRPHEELASEESRTLELKSSRLSLISALERYGTAINAAVHTEVLKIVPNNDDCLSIGQDTILRLIVEIKSHLDLDLGANEFLME